MYFVTILGHSAFFAVSALHISMNFIYCTANQSHFISNRISLFFLKICNTHNFCNLHNLGIPFDRTHYDQFQQLFHSLYNFSNS